MKNINQNINYTMTYADVKKDEPRQSGNDKFKPGLFAERCEHSYKFQTKSEFSAALSQIAHSADHIIAAKIPTQQTEWDDLVQNGKSQHKLIYIYPNEDLTHVTPLYIDTATKKVYSLPDLDGTELASLPSGYTHCMPAISIYHGKVTFQEDDLSCSYIALQFGKKIENMLTINQKLIILAGEELPSTIQEGTFIFKKNGQDPEVDYYLLPESFYGITQRRSPIILNEAIVTLVAKKQLNNPLKYAQNNAQYKIEFEKYFIRHKSSDKTDKFAYVQENIKRNSYKKTYSKKISAVKAPLMYELKQLKLEDKPKSKALALAVKTCLLTGAIPSKDFYQYFKLSQDEFWEQLRTFISQDPQQILGLIQNLQSNQNHAMVAKIVTYLVTLGSEALKKFIPQIAAELLNMKSQATCELLFSQPRLKIASDEKHNLELTKKLLASYQLAQDPTSLRAILHSIIESNLSSPNIIRFIKDQVIKHIDRDLVLKLLASNNQELNELVFSNPTIKAKISVSDILYQSLVAKNSYLDVAVAKLAKLNPKESLALVTRIPDTATKSFSNFQQQLLIKIIQQAVLELGNCGLNLSGGAKEKYATTQQLNQLLIHTVELLPSSKVLEEILAFYAKQQLKLSDAALVQILTQASLNKIDFVLMQNLIIQLGQNEFSDLLGELAAKSDAFLFAYALEIRQLSPQELAHVFNQLEKINNHEILRKIGSLISDSYEKFNDAARRTIIVNINYLICSKANSKAVIGYKLLAQFAQQLNAKNLADLAYAAHMLKFKYAAPAIEYIINNATPTQLIAFSNNAELKEIMTEIMNNSNDLNLKQLINKLDSRLNNQIQQ